MNDRKNNRRIYEMNRTFDPSGLEQTYDINPSHVVFEHVQISDAGIRNRRRSACNHSLSCDGLKLVLRLHTIILRYLRLQRTICRVTGFYVRNLT